MPSIGIPEMILILIAIVFFVRPEDLPRFFRTIGNLYGQAQRYYFQMKMYSRQTFDEISQLDQPKPAYTEDYDPWQDHLDEHGDGHDADYHDHHDYDGYVDQDHDPQHHEYEAAYAVGIPDSLEDDADDSGVGTEPAAAAPQGEEAPPAEAPPAILPEAAAGTVGRGAADEPPEKPAAPPASS